MSKYTETKLILTLGLNLYFRIGISYTTFHSYFSYSYAVLLKIFMRVFVLLNLWCNYIGHRSQYNSAISLMTSIVLKHLVSCQHGIANYYFYYCCYCNNKNDHRLNIKYPLPTFYLQNEGDYIGDGTIGYHSKWWKFKRIWYGKINGGC